MALFERSNSYDDRGGLTVSDEFTNMIFYSKITEEDTTASSEGIISNVYSSDPTIVKTWTKPPPSTGVYTRLTFDMYEKRTIKSWLWGFNVVTASTTIWNVEISNDNSTWTEVATETIIQTAGPLTWGDLTGGDHKCRYIRFTGTCTTAGGVNMTMVYLSFYV